MRLLLLSFLLLLTLLPALPARAQGTVRRHLVVFANKTGSPYSTAAPQQYLSARAIQRRQRQGIAVTTRDLPPNPAYVAQVRAAGATVVYRTRWFNGVVVSCDSTVLAQVQALPCVLTARTVSRPGRATEPPKDTATLTAAVAPSGLARPATANYYGIARNQAAMLDAVTMHDLGYRGDGIHLAVIDMGFPGVNTALPFQPLRQRGGILSTYDFVGNNTNVYKLSGHGTNAIGCIVGNQPNTYVGTAPNVSVHLFLTEDGTSEKPIEEVNWLLAAERADSVGADIITTSLVYRNFDNPFPDYTRAQMNGRTTIISRAATFASATGMLVINAAGNFSTNGIYAPADADSVLAVGAVDSLGAYSSFSSRGPTADGRIKPNVMGQGTQTALVSTTGRVLRGDGTSFSTPVIAGLAAGFWQANPNLTAQQVKQYLQASGSNVAAPNGLIGWGVPNFRRAYNLANPTNPLPDVPTITGFSPTSGPVGTVVTLTGTDLGSVTAATLNGTPLTNLTALSRTQLQVTIAAGATSGVFSVTNPLGAATSAGTFTVTTAAPDLTFTPAAGSPGSVVLVTGTGFTASSVVRFSGAAATGTVFNSPTRLTATVPAGATTGALTATTGATVLTGNAFTITTAPAPTIRLFSPTAAPVGATVTLTGTNFTGATAVRFGSVPAPGFAVVSATQLTVPVPAGAENARIYVLTPAGMAQTPAAFTLILPPTISAFSPGSGTPGAVVEITGTHLTTTTEVAFGGVPTTSFTVNSATQLTATVPAGALTGPLTVTTVAGTATSAAPFTVTVPPPPTVTGFSPAAGAAGMSVTITGTNFTGATAVRFNNVGATSFTVNSATQLTVTIPAGATTGLLSVLTSGGMGQSAVAFKVVPVPTLASFFPATGSPGAVVLLTGTGLTGATSVTIGGVAVPFTVNSATEILATVPTGAVSGLIRVTTPGGTATSAGTFGVTTPTAPRITGFTTGSGPVGTAVIITGQNLGSATVVRFGKIPATFSINGGLTITATVPAGAVSGKLYVVAAGGMAESPAVFTVIQPPTLTSVLPATGTRGSTVVLQGTNLTGATGVTFGGAAATSFTVNSARQITAVVPNAAVNGPVTVTTVAGTATAPTSFTITLPPPPTIGSLNPASGTVGTSVTLAGTNFVNVRRVLFGLKEAESFVVTSTTSLTAQVPAGAATGPIYVVADGGLGASATTFSVLLPPSISGFTPARGPAGMVVTINGSYLSGVTGVRFGATAATSFAPVSATRLTATVPAGATTAQVSVITGLGTAWSPGVFTLTAGRDTTGNAWLARQTFTPSVGAYPNPAHDRVTVQLRHWPATEPLPPAAELCDALGRRVRTAPLRDEALPTAELPLQGLTPGLYFVRIGGVTGRLLVE